MKIAEQFGLVFVDVSTGGLLPCPIPVTAGYQLPFAAAIRRAVSVNNSRLIKSQAFDLLSSLSRLNIRSVYNNP